MQIQLQCCTLPQAKQLKELGVKQESIWYWCRPNPDYVLELNDNVSQKEESYSAFTSAELGEMLPDGQTVDENYAQCETFRSIDGGYVCKFERTVYPFDDMLKFSAATEAEAKAAMIIHLLENKLM